MTDASRILDTVTRVAPLGMRFWDDVTGDIVREGLDIMAYPAGHSDLKTAAIVSPSGVYAFVHLSGLSEAEFGRGNAEYWAAVLQRPFIVQVSDHESRFMPFQFTAYIPARGLYDLECASPPGPTQAGIQLFSSPARRVPGAMAVLRAQLWDMVADAPAAYALLEASMDGRQLARGYADQQGRVALIFAYPEPPPYLFGSPLGGRRALVDQSWTVRLDAFYSPIDSPIEPLTPIPDLCQVLNQAKADLYVSMSPLLPLTEATLEFGKDLVLKSESQSVLLIAPS